MEKASSHWTSRGDVSRSLAALRTDSSLAFQGLYSNICHQGQGLSGNGSRGSFLAAVSAGDVRRLPLPMDRLANVLTPRLWH